jgi:LacI family transcriptional regulator
VNEDFAPFLMPSISYIDQFPEKIGGLASKMLSAKIKDPSNTSVNKEILETKIVHLDSTSV